MNPTTPKKDTAPHLKPHYFRDPMSPITSVPFSQHKIHRQSKAKRTVEIIHLPHEIASGITPTRKGESGSMGNFKLGWGCLTRTIKEITTLGQKSLDRMFPLEPSLLLLCGSCVWEMCVQAVFGKPFVLALQMMLLSATFCKALSRGIMSSYLILILLIGATRFQRCVAGML